MLTCERVAAEELTEKYVIGQLDETQREAFELHFFECQRCFDELQTYGALQHDLAQEREKSSAEPSWTWNWRWTSVVVALGLLLIAFAVWRQPPVRVTQRPDPKSPSTTPAAQVGENIPSTAVSQPVLLLSELARVQPPPYTPRILRGPEDNARIVFRSAMKDYVKRDYAAAIPRLRKAIRQDPRSTEAHFFLGASLLMTEQPQAAASEFRTVIASGDPQYLGQAHLGLAQTYLREGKIANARDELTMVSRLGGEEKIEADRLLHLLPAQ